MGHDAHGQWRVPKGNNHQETPFERGQVANRVTRKYLGEEAREVTRSLDVVGPCFDI